MLAEGCAAPWAGYASRMIARVFLKKGKEHPVLNRHPWVFSGAVATADGAEPGETVDFYAHEGAFLARGCWNPASQIAGRIWSWREEEINCAFFRRRVEQAVLARREWGLMLPTPAGAPGTLTDSFRLINAEADGLPGIIVDTYAGHLVVQLQTLGAVHWQNEIVEALVACAAPCGIHQRSDADIRAREGLAPVSGPLWGEAPPTDLVIHENGFAFRVDIAGGQKTGFYLDQRDNRRLFGERLAGLAVTRAGAPLAVLNAFCYTGAFSVYSLPAMRAGSLVQLDAAEDALALARVNLELNAARAAGGDVQTEYCTGNAFELLRRFRDSARQFDAIVLDPPKFAHTRGQVQGAARGYKDLNLLALKLLRPGGLLFTFSCSGAISRELFQSIVASAAADAGRDVQLLARLGAGPDHAVSLAFPEGDYLKGLVLRSG